MPTDTQTREETIADLTALLAQTEELRDRFEKHSPSAERTSILVKDCARMRGQLRQFGARV